MFCIDKAISFVTEHEHLKLTAEWIHTGKIVFDGTEMKCALTPMHKYEILKAYYASIHFTLDEKKALRAKTFEGDESDKARNISKICEYSLPDPALKEQLWREITDSQTTESLSELRNKIQGFWQRKQQLELITPYFEKYYSIVNKIVESRDREFAEVFMQNLTPAFMAREQDESAFNELLKRASEEKQFYILFLKKQIETIDITKKSRNLCETFKLN